MKNYKTDPNVLAVLNELDLLIDAFNVAISSLEQESKSSVALKYLLQQTERLRTQIACISDAKFNWIGLLQALVCIAQCVESLSR